MDKRLKIGMIFLAALGGGWSAAASHAAELVTLRNGFTLPCDHHAVEGTQVRVYISTGASSYIEFPAQEVVGIATVADVPKPPNSTSQAELPAAAPQDLHEILAGAGHRHNLDVDLLASVVKAESDGNPRARSRAGAQGLMQLMPGTAAELGVKDSYLSDQNVGGGSAYLDALLTKYHDNLALALAAYNAGPAAVDKYHGIPPYRETRLYVARVIREFNRRVRERAREAARAGVGTQVQIASSAK